MTGGSLVTRKTTLITLCFCGSHQNSDRERAGQERGLGKRFSDRVYPDIAFEGPALGGEVVACDIKAARRKEAKRTRTKTQTQSRISLYTDNTYFRDPDKNTQNIQRPFNDYALHLDVVVLYDFVKDPQPAVTNVKLVVVEPWRIVSHSRSSKTWNYIGAVTKISDIEQGNGEFDTKEAFYSYWRTYEW